MYMYQGIISFTPTSITGTVTQVFHVKTYFVVRSKKNNVNLKLNSLIFIHICSGTATTVRNNNLCFGTVTHIMSKFMTHSYRNMKMHNQNNALSDTL